MQTISKKDSEIYTLPDGSSILPTDTHHVSYHKHTPITALGSDVHQWLETVFSSDYSISREDMESLLRVLNIRWQKKALRGYFSQLLRNNETTDMSQELATAIHSFPTKNWTDKNWQSFWNLAPNSYWKKPTLSTRIPDKKRRNRYLGHDAWFRATVFGYEGSHNSLDGRGDS